MRKLVGATIVALMVLLGLTLGTAASGSGGKDLLDWDVMAPVDGPFVGTGTPVRGVPGGGLPWELDRARGELRSDGRLKVRVEGLVLARKAPVPPAAQGTNPVPQFRAIVSCLTEASPINGENVSTAPFDASPKGDAKVDTHVTLPSTCFAPIVFVTSPTGAWFAVTGG